jgi:hypothetical protein
LTNPFVTGGFPTPPPSESSDRSRWRQYRCDGEIPSDHLPHLIKLDHHEITGFDPVSEHRFVDRPGHKQATVAH